MQAAGQVTELLLVDGHACARVHCEAAVIPAPGQYVLAHAAGSDAPLATPLFGLMSSADGFVAAPPTPSMWYPGTRLLLRGPLGHGFSLPAVGHQVGLIGFHCPPRLLLSLLEPAFRQGASVTLVGDQIPDDLPPQVEAQPLGDLLNVCQWADFIAIDIQRERLPELRQLFQPHQSRMKVEGQVLIRTPMPCGALADCGVCAVVLRGKPLLACEDGPVFELRQALEWSSRA